MCLFLASLAAASDRPRRRKEEDPFLTPLVLCFPCCSQWPSVPSPALMVSFHSNRGRNQGKSCCTAVLARFHLHFPCSTPSLLHNQISMCALMVSPYSVSIWLGAA